MESIQLNASSRMRLIVFKFRVSNMQHIPLGVEYREANPQESRVDSESGGAMVIDRRDKSSLAEVLKAIEPTEYVLVDASCTPVPQKDFCSDGYMVKFVFCRREYARSSAEFDARRQKISTGLWALCKDALWSVRIYSNPHFEDGKRVPDAYSMSINCAGRLALVDENGKPVTVWPRNAAGKPQKSGTKVPLAPEYVFRMKSKPPELVAAD